MKTIAAILCLALASCTTIPRAIIPPPSVIAELNVKPVAGAATKTRDAVREVAKASSASSEIGRKLSDTSELLVASLDRARMLAKAKGQIKDAYEEAYRFGMQMAAQVDELKSAQALSDAKVSAALKTVDFLGGEVNKLEGNASAQAAHIRNAKATEDTLRTQVSALSESAGKRVIAEDKLAFWRWRFAPVSLGIIALLAAFIVYRPRIPFLT